MQQKKKKRLIKSHIELHNRNQIEAVFNYNIFTKSQKEDVLHKGIDYKVETTFFIPKQLGINEDTYSKKMFYEDLTPMIRFREPRFKYKQMLGVESELISPLQVLRKHIESLSSDAEVYSTSEAITEVNIFACSFLGYFVRKFNREKRKIIAKAKKDNYNEAELRESLSKILNVVDKSYVLIKEYRKLIVKLNDLNLEKAQKLKKEMLIVDEYCAIRFRDFLIWFVEHNKNLEKKAGKIIIVAENCEEKIAAFIKKENTYARKMKYNILTSKTTRKQVSKYMHRIALMKRHIWSFLYLDLRVKSAFKAKRQFGPMVAAGFAALWAAVIQLMILRDFLSEHQRAEGTHNLAMLSFSGMTFIAVVIIAYIVKDRIKDVFNIFFKNGFIFKMPDSNEKISFRSAKGDLNIGSWDEKVDFVQSKNLPEYLKEKYNTYLDNNLGAAPDILLYHKNIKFSSKITHLNRYSLSAVHDIMRYDFSFFFKKMAETNQKNKYVDNNGVVKEVSSKRVYYIDMVTSYQNIAKTNFIQGTKLKETNTVDYSRLVMDKDGLIDIEQL